MLRLLKIAITGGLSSGKSTVSRFFKEFGAYVVSADEIVHRLLSQNTLIGHRVIELLGPEIIVDSQINRLQIAKIVFKNPDLLKALEQILHPAVKLEIEEEYKTLLTRKMQTSDESTPFLFAAEIPLLFEAGGRSFFNYDYSISVVADKEKSMKRFRLSSGLDNEEFELRSSFQLSSEEKAQKADFVLINNGTLENLRESVNKVIDLILTRSSSLNE